MADFFRSMNRLAKWRSHFAGWQLGTRSIDDPECQAVRDHREATMMLRVEATAVVALLIQKGVITERELEAAMAEEADQLEKAYQQRWPGASASDDGMVYTAQAMTWMQGWKP